MKMLLTSIALATVIASPAFAQAPSHDPFVPRSSSTWVYTPTEQWAPSQTYDQARERTRAPIGQYVIPTSRSYNAYGAYGQRFTYR
jgi:hypothetical protein